MLAKYGGEAIATLFMTVGREERSLTAMRPDNAASMNG